MRLSVTAIFARISPLIPKGFASNSPEPHGGDDERRRLNPAQTRCTEGPFLRPSHARQHFRVISWPRSKDGLDAGPGPITEAAARRFTRWAALSVFVALAACSTDPVHLEPIPAPPPVIVPVPQYVPLPADATMPCQKPAPRSIKTDVDLLNAAMAFKVYGDCNANKLQAIGEKQP